jgi:epoxyqueuosine reductase QueG
MMNYKLPLSDILPCGVCRFSDVGELLQCRAKSRIPENAKSVIVYLFPYYLGDKFYKNSNISKYAVSEDYHNIVGNMLKGIIEELKSNFPNNKFEYFCDNSPIKEVEASFLCGLGVKGRNGLLINKDYGSFCFVGEIVTDVEFPYSLPEDRDCLNCGICEKMCPNKAIHKGRVDIEKCLSDITQRKGELTQEQTSLIEKSDSIWGCDVCQNVCPMNKNIKVTPIKEFFDSAIKTFNIGDNIDGRAYAWRGRAVIERNFKIKYCKDNQNIL